MSALRSSISCTKAAALADRAAASGALLAVAVAARASAVANLSFNPFCVASLAMDSSAVAYSVRSTCKIDDSCIVSPSHFSS